MRSNTNLTLQSSRRYRFVTSRTVSRTQMGVQLHTSLIPMAEASSGAYAICTMSHLGTHNLVDTELNLLVSAYLLFNQNYHL